MAEPEADNFACSAGRTAFFGGKWADPCELETENQHVIGSTGLPAAIILCDTHFNEALEAGLITDPYLGPEEYNRRREAEGYPPAPPGSI